MLAPLINVPFSEIDHSKRDKQQKGLKTKGSFDRDKVISRIVERHRRLVKKNLKNLKIILTIGCFHKNFPRGNNVIF